MFNQKLNGNSLIEIMITLLIFSVAATSISSYINRDIGGIKQAEKQISEIFLECT